MDKRSWPWKKKTSDKNTDVHESSPSQALRPYDDQCQADEKIRRLNERLLAADDLAKQHATVAEEAVSGWEKAKAEYMSVKYQFDTVLEQKQAAEVRVFHLDGALKECMQQLRQVREEQEQRIHEAIIKRNRDWDKTRLDLEERLADADQELIEARNQKNLLYKTVQEQAEAIGELGQIRSQAEAEIKKLQVQIQTLEKENTSLKYKIVILNKELDIRNQEREINNRSFDMASRQHIEGTKRIAKLEAECQRLRALVRRKLPGPGALLQMKLEAGMDAEKGDFYYKRRFGGRAASSPKAAHSDSIALSDRLVALEEETEMLKEALARRNKDLQTARLLCAQTTDKLSSFEGQVGQFQNSPRVPFIGPRFHAVESFHSKEPSQLSMSEDGNDDEQSIADSWTSGLIRDLAYLQKEKLTQQQSNTVHSPKLLERLNSIDDFMEIERLVSFPSENPGVESNINVELSPSSISKQVLAKDAELQAANRLYAEVNQKLAQGEEQMSMLRTKNVANELNLFSLQQNLITILEAPERGDPEMVLEKIRNAVLASQCSSMDGLQAHVRKLSGVAAPDHSTGILCSMESSHVQESSHVKCYSEGKIGPELTSVVCKVVRAVEDLALESMAQHLTTSSLKEGRDVDSGDGHQDTPKPRPSELEASVRNFNAVSSQYLYGKAKLVQFMAELCSVLSQLKNLSSSKAYGSLSSRMKWRAEAVQVAEQDVFSDVGSPVSLASNSDVSESVTAKAFPADDRLASLKRGSLDEDLRNVRAEKAALESHLRAELSKMATMEHTLTELEQEKAELEKKLEEERDKFRTVKGQLLDSEQLVATLRAARLTSAEFPGNVAEKSLSSYSTVKAKLEAQLEDSRFELTHMHEKLTNLERVIDQEQRKNEGLQMKVDELEAFRQRASSSGFQDDAERSNKEQEIADATEKLAACQRTIFVLGRQLKDIVSAQDVGSVATKLSTNQFQEDAPKHGNTTSTPQKAKQKAPTSDPGVCSISDATIDELNSSAECPGPGLERPVSDLIVDEASVYRDDVQGKLRLLHTDADKQLVKYVPKPASRKKTTLHPFAGIDMSKSLNLEPSASPRKHGNGFSKFFSRHKNPS